MKKYFSIIIIAVGISLVGCKQSASNNTNSSKEQIAEVYTCSMHPEVESDKPGKCPKCGMELIKKDENNHPDSSSNVDDEIK